jgi:hypothetical protein
MLETATLIAIVIGLTEVIKKASGLSSRYIPLTSLVVSLVLVFIFNNFNQHADISAVIFTGIVAGLTASGLYGGVKKTIKG